jgi:N-methylhydantoinase B
VRFRQTPIRLGVGGALALVWASLGVFNAIGHGVPPNAGSFRRLRVLLRENCCVGIPRHPASTSVATTNLADRVSCGVQRALAEANAAIVHASGTQGMSRAARDVG